MAVEYLASPVNVAQALPDSCSCRGRTIECHRAQIRKACGSRPPSEADEERWAGWLAAEGVPGRDRPGRLAGAVGQRCRSENIEAPAEGQLERVVASAGRRFEEAFATGVAGRLGPAARPPVRDGAIDVFSRRLAGLVVTLER